MPIKINDDFMYMEIDGTVIAIASRPAGGWWDVSPLAPVLDRDQAITTLTITELLEGGAPGNPGAVHADFTGSLSRR